MILFIQRQRANWIESTTAYDNYSLRDNCCAIFWLDRHHQSGYAPIFAHVKNHDTLTWSHVLTVKLVVICCDTT